MIPDKMRCGYGPEPTQPRCPKRATLGFQIKTDAGKVKIRFCFTHAGHGLDLFLSEQRPTDLKMKVWRITR